MLWAQYNLGIKRTIPDDDDDLEFLPQDNPNEGSDEGRDDGELTAILQGYTSLIFVKADIEKAAIGSDDFIVPDSAPTKTPRKSRDSKKRKKSSNDLRGTAPSTAKTPTSTSRFAFSPKSCNSTPLPSVVTHRPKPPTPSGRKDRDEVRYFWLVDIKDADGNPRMLFTREIYSC